MFNNALKLLSTTFLSRPFDLKMLLLRNSGCIASKSCLAGSVGFLERTSRNFHTTRPQQKDVDRRHMIQLVSKSDHGTIGEKLYDIDTMLTEQDSWFPDENTPTTLFNGIPFKQTPICSINCTKNNTHIVFSDYNGKLLVKRTCGIEGFKKARKGTNVAAQQAAGTIGTIALKLGIKTIRIKIKGIGPGRMSSVKGLQLSGLEIISITDDTPISWHPPRPRKQRKL